MRWKRHRTFNERLSSEHDRSSRGFGLLSGVLLVFVAVIAHVWSINRTAIQGYAVRVVEREMSETQAENQKLRITEAELLSLGRIEEAKGRLQLIETQPGSQDVSYMDARMPLALR